MLKSGSENSRRCNDPRKNWKGIDLSKVNQVTFFLFIVINNTTESRCLSLKICTSSRRFQGKKATVNQARKKRDCKKKVCKKTSRCKKSRESNPCSKTSRNYILSARESHQKQLKLPSADTQGEMKNVQSRNPKLPGPREWQSDEGAWKVTPTPH